MKKIYWLRRTAFVLTIFALGTLVSGNVPTWMKIGFPTVVMFWLMIYDDAAFELRTRSVKKVD
nr:MAG TPA: YvrJ protein family protein [Caudoviricetes sp.]